jgi:hypothetical protein
MTTYTFNAKWEIVDVTVEASDLGEALEKAGFIAYGALYSDGSAFTLTQTKES